MSTEQQGTLTAPPPTNASYPLAYTQIPWNGATSYAFPYTLRDPITGAGVFVTTNNALKVDASATVQPVTLSSLPLPNGAAQDGTDASGVTAPSGGVGIRGWLSGSYGLLAAGINVTLQNGIGVNANGTGQFAALTDTTTPVDIGANASMTINGVTGKAIRVTAFLMMASAPGSGAGTVQFWDSTANEAISGPMAVTPETGAQGGNGAGPVITVPVGHSLQIKCANGASVQGFISTATF